MNDDFLCDLNILVDNALFDQFESYDYPLVIAPAFILEGTAKSIGRLLKERADPKNTSGCLGTLERLANRIPERSISRFKVATYIPIFEGLIPCMEDQQLGDARGATFRVTTRLLGLFDFVGQYLLLRRLFKLVADGIIKVTYEPQVLAWIIDAYRRSLAASQPEAAIFRDELTYFYMDISRVNYREVELCFQYFVATCLLGRFHATLGFNRPLLKMAKDTVLDPIYTQVSDFKALCQLKEDGEKFQHMEFLLLSLSQSMRVINKALSDK